MSLPQTWSMPARLLGFSAGVVSALLVAGGLAFLQELPREIAWMSGIFVLAAFLWVLDVIPAHWTSLLVLMLEVVLFGNPWKWGFLGFSEGGGPRFRQVLVWGLDPVLLLFLGGFVLARAAVTTGADQAVSAVLLRPFRTSPSRLLFGILLVTAGVSMWMSNTATTALMLSLLGPTLSGIPKGHSFRKALVLSVPLAANVGGMATPIASPPNAIASGHLESAGFAVPFVGWMALAVPIVLVLLFLAWRLLLICFPPAGLDLGLCPESRPFSGAARTVIGIASVTILLWMSTPIHGLPAAWIALVAVLLLMLVGIVSARDLASIEWSVLILVAGGIALGTGMQETGLDRHLAALLDPGPSQASRLPWILAVTTLVLGNFMSNTAIATLLIPVAAVATESAQAGVGVETPLVESTLVIAFVASLTMCLPSSTPPNAMAYASGEFSSRELMRVATPLAMIGTLLVVLAFRVGGVQLIGGR